MGISPTITIVCVFTPSSSIPSRIFPTSSTSWTWFDSRLFSCGRARLWGSDTFVVWRLAEFSSGLLQVSFKHVNYLAKFNQLLLELYFRQNSRTPTLPMNQRHLAQRKCDPQENWYEGHRAIRPKFDLVSVISNVKKITTIDIWKVTRDRY